MYGAIKLPPQDLYRHVEEVAGDELVQVLQIHNKISRRKALSSLEDQVINILTEKGYASKGKGLPEILPELSKDEDDEVVEDRGVDEGDVHVKPVTRKATPLLYSEFDVKLVFKEVKAVPDRRELIDEEQTFGVIVDYAQTPNGLSRLLGYVQELGPMRIITVFDCPAEKDRGTRLVMTKISTDKSDVKARLQAMGEKNKVDANKPMRVKVLRVGHKHGQMRSYI